MLWFGDLFWAGFRVVVCVILCFVIGMVLGCASLRVCVGWCHWFGFVVVGLGCFVGLVCLWVLGCALWWLSVFWIVVGFGVCFPVLDLRWVGDWLVGWFRLFVFGC